MTAPRYVTDAEAERIDLAIRGDIKTGIRQQVNAEQAAIRLLATRKALLKSHDALLALFDRDDCPACNARHECEPDCEARAARALAAQIRGTK